MVGIEAEAAEFIGATRYERSAYGTNERNGSRPRMLRCPGRDMITVGKEIVRNGF